MPTNSHFDLDERKIETKFRLGIGMGQKVLDLQVMQDTEAYVPMEQGDLYRSAQRASKLGSGEIIYDTPYAARQYYTMPDKSTAAHGKATMRWFEVSKAVNKSRWIQVAKKAFGRAW